MINTAIDSIDLGIVDGFQIHAELFDDPTYYGDGPDGDYSDEQIAAYRAGDWYYTVIVVTASRAGHKLGSDTLGLVEYGTIPGAGEIDPLNDEHGSLAAYRADMVDNAVADARMTLSQINDPITATN
jgi:hypothetical protein